MHKKTEIICRGCFALNTACGKCKRCLLEQLNIINIVGHADHVECEDGWYSCPKCPTGCSRDLGDDYCNCGADFHNERLSQSIEKAKEILNGLI